MLRVLRKFGGNARALATVFTSSVPLLIIGGLLYAGLFVKAEARIQKVDPPAIELRDNFFGLTRADEKVVWAVGSTGKIVRSEDGGTSWVRQDSGINVNLMSIAAWDAQSAVAVGNGGAILYTHDGGRTWTAATVPASDHPSKFLRVRIAGDSAWVVGEFNAMLRSADRGKTWQRVLNAEDRGLNDIAFVGKNGWAVGEFGSVLLTTDGGATWNPVATANKVSLMSVAFRDASNGVAVGLTGTLLTTRDGGQHWNVIAGLTREHFFQVIWDDDRWLAIGDKGVVGISDADAGKWTVGRVTPGDVAWRTQVVKAGERYVVAGMNLAAIDDSKFAAGNSSSEGSQK